MSLCNDSQHLRQLYLKYSFVEEDLSSVTKFELIVYISFMSGSFTELNHYLVLKIEDTTLCQRWNLNLQLVMSPTLHQQSYGDPMMIHQQSHKTLFAIVKPTIYLPKKKFRIHFSLTQCALKMLAA